MFKTRNSNSFCGGLLSKALKSLWFDCSMKEDLVDQQAISNVRDVVAESTKGGSCSLWIATGTMLV